MKPSIPCRLALALLAGGSGLSVAAGDAVHGEQLYQSKCAACHSLDDNELGPRHRGVFGRQAGAVADYAYSAAVKNSGIVWTADKLDRWLLGPERLIPGQQMNVSVPSAADRLDLIAYLMRESARP